MDHAGLINRLDANCQVIVGLLAAVTNHQARWKPMADRWSLIEVAAHLCDEEWEDFKPRLVGVLTEDDYLPPRLAGPESRAEERKYIEWSLPETVANFEGERIKSVEYLRSLKSPDWTRGFEIPNVLTLDAEGILSAWVAHDLLHIRQITALHFQFLEDHVKPKDVEYAGVFEAPLSFQAPVGK